MIDKLKDWFYYTIAERVFENLLIGIVWINDNQKKVRLTSYTFLIITLLNTIFAILSGTFMMYPDFFVGVLVAQVAISFFIHLITHEQD